VAYTRSPRGRRRGGGRRFFRRRRGFRPTTEAGSRIERCYFNVGVDQPIGDVPNAPTYDAIMLASPQSLVEGLLSAGSQAAAVARVLQLPVRDLSVSGLTFDVSVTLSGGTFESPNGAGAADINTKTVQCGLAIYTQRLDASGAPTNLPVYDLSQWPVNGTDGFSDATEDLDYATRTHYHRATTLAPNQLATPIIDPIVQIFIPGRPNTGWSARVKVGRRISDSYGLFLGFWVKPPNPVWSNEGATSAFWRVTGSMWYKMRM